MAWKLDAFSTYDKRTPLLFVDDSAGVVCRLTTGAHGGPLDVIVPREMYGLTTRDRNAIRAWATRQLRAQSRATVASMESLDDDTDDTGP